MFVVICYPTVGKGPRFGGLKTFLLGEKGRERGRMEMIEEEGEGEEKKPQVSMQLCMTLSQSGCASCVLIFLIVLNNYNLTHSLPKFPKWGGWESPDNSRKEERQGY